MLAQLAAFLLGLLAGGMLVIAVVLVPFWSALPPADLRAWFARHAGRTGALMFPLGAAATAAAAAAWLADRARWPALAAGAAAGVVAVTLLVNEPANRRFAGPVYLSDADVVALLGGDGTGCASRSAWSRSRRRCGRSAEPAASPAPRSARVAPPRHAC